MATGGDPRGMSRWPGQPAPAPAQPGTGFAAGGDPRGTPRTPQATGSTVPNGGVSGINAGVKKMGPLGGMWKNTAALGAWPPAAAPAAATPDYGTQSGPTYIEDRYTSRANGTDPGWEYATGKATDAINKQYAARGGYNSSGAMNQIGDMFANATSQREGQLDALAAGATTGHQNALNSMFTEGLGIAGGVTAAGAPGAKGIGDSMSQDSRTQLELAAARAGVDAKALQAAVDQGTDVASAIASLQGGGGKK